MGDNITIETIESVNLLSKKFDINKKRMSNPESKLYSCTRKNVLRL
mgnify:CR=1